MSKKNSKKVENPVVEESMDILENAQPAEKPINNLESEESSNMTNKLLDRIAQLEAQLEETKKRNKALEESGAKAQGGERKSQVLKLLEEKGPISIKGMATVLNTTTRNISSVLTAIRNAGWTIHTDNVGQKYIVERPAIDAE